MDLFCDNTTENAVYKHSKISFSFLRRHIFTYENFAQEYGQKNLKNKMHTKLVKMDKK